MALAILVLQGQIQTVPPVYLLYYFSTKLALFLAQMDIINQAQFANHAMALAILVLQGQIQTVSPV